MAKKNQNRKEKSMIEACIIRSKFIIASNSFKHQLKEAVFFHNRMSMPLPSSGYLKELREEANDRIDDHERTIARYLKPLFKTHGLRIDWEANEGEEKFKFGYDDLKKGFVELSTDKTRPKILSAVTHILFLTDVKDLFSNTIYEAGTIHKKDEVNHILMDVKGLIVADSIMVQYAIKRLKS